MSKIWSKLLILLDRKQKMQMAGIVFMMLIGGVLESVGISLIVPVMTIVVNPAAVNTNSVLKFIYDTFSFTRVIQLATLIMLSLVFVFVIKNIFLYFMNVVQLRFVYTNQFSTSRRMMINFMTHVNDAVDGFGCA